MKRRRFLKKAGFAAGTPLMFHGVPLKLMASEQPLSRMAAQSANDNVLVIIQLHGGNDGINTFVPLDQYDAYYNRRANIAIPYKVGTRTAIPLDNTLPLEDQVGLHPDMIDFKNMYDEGRVAVFQGVSYENNNGSHFRGRDIWFMGGNADDYFSSGWIGRYLNQEFSPLIYPQDFPTTEMPDPLALEMGNDLSLIFHQTGNIPTSISLGNSPQSLANSIAELEGFVDEGIDPRGLPPTFLSGSPYGKEMDWILGLEDKSETYIDRLAEIYQSSAETQVDYPEIYPFNAPQGSRSNPLSSQLQLVARLIGGGAKTKVYLVKIGGFDTHAEQVETYDATMGIHAARLYHITSAMRAFTNDLERRGISSRVLTMTMSEFGRRIGSNGSYGTDHGTGGPVMLFGNGLQPGVYGTNPSMEDNNVAMQYDYRQVYANILHDWMGVDENTLANDIFFGNFISGPNPEGGNFEPINIRRDVILNTESFQKRRFRIQNVFPNPANDETTFTLELNDNQEVQMELLDLAGRFHWRQTRKLNSGSHNISIDLKGLSPGTYFLKAKSDKLNDTKQLIIR